MHKKKIANPIKELRFILSRGFSVFFSLFIGIFLSTFLSSCAAILQSFDISATLSGFEVEEVS